jgi:hypothetical protein
MDDAEMLDALLAEAVRRGYPPTALDDVTDLAAARRLLGMDDRQPWHPMRVTLPSDTFDDAIRGSDTEQALANARWNWPSATAIALLPGAA